MIGVAASTPKIMKDEEEETTFYCDVCIDGFSDYGTRSELIQAGWFITDTVILCPQHNFG
jgi:hypothetical protein